MGMEGIGAYICMLQAIYIYREFGTLAAKVSINKNIMGLLESNDTHLTCSFIQEKNETFLNVGIIAKTLTDDFYNKKPIAIFEPERAAKLHSSGEYLSGRVTLTNITRTSTYATLTFHKLKWTDEKDYICKYYFYDMDGAVSTMKSEASRILVKVPVRDVHINKQPNHKQYDRKTDNITLTCKGSGNPEPRYTWFKEHNNNTIISRRNLYVIEDVIRNKSGVYICEAYNIINNVNYTQSYSVEIDIADVSLPTTEPALREIFLGHAAYAISVICAVVIVVICFAVRKRNCKREARNEPAVIVIYSKVNEHTKLKYRLRENETTSVQPDNVDQIAMDAVHGVSRDPRLKYNMITEKLEVYKDA